MAGSAVLRFGSQADNLRVVTLTVNNVCNLTCPHCYLQYDGRSGVIGEDVLAALEVAEFDHLAIVGKEPFASVESSQLVEGIIRRFSESGKSVSVITNGLGLHHVDGKTYEQLAWIDVSFDGGPASYSGYRGRPYAEVVRNLNRLQHFRYGHVNALHVMSESNRRHTDDMMAVARDFPFERLIFSPYVHTRHGHDRLVSALTVESFFGTLVDCPAFMDAPNSIALLGADTFDEVDPAALRQTLFRLGLESKVVLLDDDPLRFGFIRLTYDGLVLTPYESLHTGEYRQWGRPLAGQSLNGLYKQLRFSEAA